MRSPGASRKRSMPSSPPIDALVHRRGAQWRPQDPPGSPALPITPQELADCAAACRDAGASMLHLHVRNAEGGHSLAPADYRPAIDAVRRAVGRSLVLQLTSEAVGIYAPAEQRAMVRELRPEAVSLALREILPDAASEPESAAFLAWAHREQIVAQYILYGADDVERYSELQAAWRHSRRPTMGALRIGPLHAGQRSSLADLLPMLAAWRAAGEITAGSSLVDLRLRPAGDRMQSRRRRAWRACADRIREQSAAARWQGRARQRRAGKLLCRGCRAAWPFICQRRPPTRPIPLISEPHLDLRTGVVCRAAYA